MELMKLKITNFLQVKNKSNFVGLDFSKLRDIEPPYIPEIANMEDMANFEKEKIVWDDSEILDPTKKGALFFSDAKA